MAAKRQLWGSEAFCANVNHLCVCVNSVYLKGNDERIKGLVTMSGESECQAYLATPGDDGCWLHSCRLRKQPPYNMTDAAPDSSERNRCGDYHSWQASRIWQRCRTVRLFLGCSQCFEVLWHYWKSVFCKQHLKKSNGEIEACTPWGIKDVRPTNTWRWWSSNQLYTWNTLTFIVFKSIKLVHTVS